MLDQEIGRIEVVHDEVWGSKVNRLAMRYGDEQNTHTVPQFGLSFALRYRDQEIGRIEVGSVEVGVRHCEVDEVAVDSRKGLKSNLILARKRKP